MNDSIPDPNAPWYKELNRSHWWIMIVCILGWTFDTMDQRLFSLARGDAMAEFIGRRIEAMDSTALQAEIRKHELEIDATLPEKDRRDRLVQILSSAEGRTATMIFIFGWATGGIFFGILGDKWGRAKTMMLTILVYAIFTAGSGLAQNTFQFHTLRFLTGLGVGGEFAAGASLLAEVIPERPRPYALGLMQGLSAVGNMTGSVIGLIQARLGLSWRYLFFAGVIPAFLVVAIRRRLKEPESWVKAKAEASDAKGKRMGSYRDLFGHPRWRKNAIIGMTIAVVGVTGLWGVGFYTPELITEALGDRFRADVIADLPEGETRTEEEIDELASARLKEKRSIMFFFQDLGAFLSMYGFAVVSARIGRRLTFMLSCLVGMLSIWVVFGFLNDPSQIYWMGLLLGFGTLALFGGYAIYFPEIFPTRMRSTGVSLCYNVGRYLAGFIQGPFPTMIFRRYRNNYSRLKAYRATNMTVALIYIVGIVVMFFAPETAGKPLPTDDDEPQGA